eukprot:gb/GEZN01005459.1/.p1 GENE.gb/GEZN01005459.1/~~gb/GEZN01005459.1/.p1  ORF type:complete len:476 (-),score=43.57 gb/GEZN01005459.1/:356-1783(-)
MRRARVLDLSSLGEDLRPKNQVFIDPDKSYARALLWILMWVGIIAWSLGLLLYTLKAENRPTVSVTEELYPSDTENLLEEQKRGYRSTIETLTGKNEARVDTAQRELWSLDCPCENVVSYDSVYVSTSVPRRRLADKMPRVPIAERMLRQKQQTARQRRQAQEWTSGDPLGATNDNMRNECWNVSKQLPNLGEAFGLFCDASTRSVTQSFIFTQRVPAVGVMSMDKFRKLTEKAWEKQCMSVMANWRYQMEALTAFYTTIKFDHVLFSNSLNNGSGVINTDKWQTGSFHKQSDKEHPLHEWVYCFNTPTESNCVNGDAAQFMVDYLIDLSAEDCAAFFEPTGTSSQGIQGLGWKEAYSNYLDACAPAQCIYLEVQPLEGVLYDWFAIITSLQQLVFTVVVFIYGTRYTCRASKSEGGKNEGGGEDVNLSTISPGKELGMSPVAEVLQVDDSQTGNLGTPSGQQRRLQDEDESLLK